MEVTTNVSLNTSLADLDEALRSLLRRELGQTGFDAVAVAFEAPDREWAASVSQPTLNLFLYDLRENRQRRKSSWDEQGGGSNGGRSQSRPPLWLDASYTLTAFSRAVEDEHRLLSQALTVLAGYPELPDAVLPASLASLCRQFGVLHSRVGDPRHDATPDFWTAVGGAYKLSFHYIVTLPIPSGTVLHRGPPVRMAEIKVGDRVGRRGELVERTRVGGEVHEPDGAAAARVWVFVPELGRAGETDAGGRFTLTQIPPGSYTVQARDQDGREAEGVLQVPGDLLVLTLPEASR
jgi:hypothetical protein